MKSDVGSNQEMMAQHLENHREILACSQRTVNIQHSIQSIKIIYLTSMVCAWCIALIAVCAIALVVKVTKAQPGKIMWSHVCIRSIQVMISKQVSWAS